MRPLAVRAANHHCRWPCSPGLNAGHPLAHARQGIGENHSDSDQTMPELLNCFGADGWELAGLHDCREGGDGSSYWGGDSAAYRIHLQTPGT